MKRYLLAVATILAASACSIFNPPHPPGPPQPKQVVVRVHDQDKLVAGALVGIIGDFGYQAALRTDNVGGAVFQVPASQALGAQVTVSDVVECEVYTQRANLSDPGEINVALKCNHIPPKPTWKQIEEATTESQLRNFKGDFGGIYVDSLKAECTNGHFDCQNAHGLRNGALFTPTYIFYNDQQRADIRAAYKARGYTHFPVSIFPEPARGYHGIFPPNDMTHISQFLEELWADGIYPVCFVMQDQQNAADAEVNAARLEDRNLCRIVVPKWEINDPDGSDGQRMANEFLATRAAFPNALVYAHFTPQHAAGCVTDGCESGWWRWMHDVVHATGILYQDDRWNDPDAVNDRVGDFLIRLGGGASGWPGGMDTVLFETDIYTKFWDGRTEQQGIDFNNKILAARMDQQVCSGSACGRLAGFNSGGTVRSAPSQSGKLTAWPEGVFRRADGSVFQWRGASDFLLYQRFLAGENIAPVLDERAGLGANVVRVLGMVDSFAHFYPQEHGDYYSKLPLFVQTLAAHGLRLEFVAFADAQVIIPGDGDRTDHLNRVVSALAGADTVFIEVANEPFKNLPGGDAEARDRALAVRGRGILIASGAYTDWPPLQVADYGTTHADRTDDWPRKAKDVMDLRDAMRAPWVSDEPMGAAETDQPGKRSANESDFAWFAATAGLEGAGATFHSDAGILSQPFGPVQLKLAQAFYAALKWVPADAPLWPYQRGDQGSEAGIGNMPILHDDGKELRSFCKGNGSSEWCVQIRTIRAHASPRDGWVIADEPRPGLVHLGR